MLVALYENGTPFEPRIVDLGDPADKAEVLAAWPVGKIPILVDRGRTVPESTPIIEYLQRHHPGPVPVLPADADARFEARLWDRFFDLYVQQPMQKIVADRLRADGEHDARGVAEAKAGLATAYAMLERRLDQGGWAAGAAFTIADCAAAPALFYATIVAPLPAGHGRLEAYIERLTARPSVQRTLAEARPYFGLFPFSDAIPARYR